MPGTIITGSKNRRHSFRSKRNSLKCLSPLKRFRMNPSLRNLKKPRKRPRNLKRRTKILLRKLR